MRGKKLRTPRSVVPIPTVNFSRTEFSFVISSTPTPPCSCTHHAWHFHNCWECFSKLGPWHASARFCTPSSANFDRHFASPVTRLARPVGWVGAGREAAAVPLNERGALVPPLRHRRPGGQREPRAAGGHRGRRRRLGVSHRGFRRCEAGRQVVSAPTLYRKEGRSRGDTGCSPSRSHIMSVLAVLGRRRRRRTGRASRMDASDEMYPCICRRMAPCEALGSDPRTCSSRRYLSVALRGLETVGD